MSQTIEDNRKKWPGGPQDFTVIRKNVSKHVWENPSDYNKGGKYTKVHAWTWRGGQSIEVDETEEGKRIRVIHPNGSYVDMQHDGTVIHRSSGNMQEVVVKDRSVKVKGSENVHVEGDANWKTDGDVTWKIGGVLRIAAEKIVFETPLFHVEGDAMSHNDKDVGWTHRHKDVMPGGALTGLPIEGQDE